MILTDKRFISSDPKNLPVITIFGPVAPPERPGIFCQDGETLRKRRKEIGGALRPAILKRLEPEFRVLAARLVDQAVAKGTVEFISEIAHPLPTTAIGDVLGIPEEDRAQFYKWSDSFISPFDERMIEEAAGGLEALLGIWDYALKATKLKRECPADDVLTALALSDATDGEIQGDIATFAAGAGETTRAVLGHAIHELMRRPEQMEWLRAHADDIPSTAIDELLRVAAPVIQQVRTATEDVEIHGQLIRPGSGSPRCCPRPTSTARCSPIPASSTSPAHRTRTCRSGWARTSASGGTSPSWRSRWCWRSCCGAPATSARPGRSPT
jgi:cholest-4-en-3-one 26-monooxygenase